MGNSLAPVRVPTLILVVLVFMIGCCAVARKRWEPHESNTIVRLIVNSHYAGPVYIILDPLLGIDPPLESDGYHYRFDERGILRVRTEEQWGLGGKWVRAQSTDGTPLPFERGEWGSSKGSLPISVWVILESENDEKYYSDWLASLEEQLRSRGEVDLGWTPERRALYAAQKATADRSIPAVFPQSTGPDRPLPVFEVPAGYTGPIYLITDPFGGQLPEVRGDRVLFSFPANGVLRVKLTGEMSASRSWPLVYDATGAQLWLRPLAKSSGFDTLPIVSYLVCPSATEIPSYPDPQQTSLLEQLRALGEADLKWPEPDSGAIRPAATKPR